METNGITALACLSLGLAFPPSTVYAQGSGYMGIGLGQAAYRDGLFKDSGTLATLYAGYRLTEQLSLELAYIDLGKAEDRVVPDGVISLTQDTLHLDVSAFTIAPALRQRILPSLEVSALAGLAVLDVQKTWWGGTVVDPVLAEDTGGIETQPFWGLRLLYEISGTQAVGMSWQHHEAEGVAIEAVYGSFQASF
jgi:hypothetical protein